MKNLLLVTLMILTATSCNKTKQAANTLENTTWKFTSLKIDTVNESALATLSFQDGDIYNEILVGNWYNTDTTHSGDVSFAWQFRDKGKTFEISNQSEGDNALQCSQLSGIYSVSKLDKTTFTITSTSTLGYPNKKVEIELSKK